MSMNPDIKKKWVKALRSGKYKQGRYLLKSDEGYCCLGVLCDIYFTENGISWENINDECYEKHSKGPKECIGRMFTPPPKIIKWAGLNARNPFISFGDKKLKITFWNDGSEPKLPPRKSFEELATAIEEQL